MLNGDRKTGFSNQRAVDIAKYSAHIFYSERYYDDEFEYRHVTLPKQLVKYLTAELMSEDEWRGLGVQQSPGWIHYMIHAPERHILLFRREKDYELKYKKKL
ncbi:Cyclin-dependent kinases regulatory subunit [Dimargaris verticillata]|uniref:Cyclin-dependent kinases regulatory subunit n=1 Tax=Dimargaris verticillata TaxID=2761393 RepID=A0A9W8EE10_9FUNG|nr:Cyclin-dependent kinases regulatory subunit [Dimargaris verticillata]